MKLQRFEVESYMTLHENNCRYNLADTVAKSLTLKELLAYDKKDSLEDLMNLSLDYGAIEGSHELKKGILSLYQSGDDEEIAICHGGVNANELVLMTLLSTNDHILSFLPTYQQLYSFPESLGVEVDFIHLKEENVQVRIKTMLESKNLELAGSYHQEPMSYPALLSWCEKQASLFAPYICDTGSFLENALASHKKVVLEAQLGAMRDIDYGIFPYTSSSSTISAYGPIGAGIPGESLDHVVGVLKAYSTCVGAGPFVAERAMSEDWCNILRKFGNEYGAATGRPRRVGPFDAVASRYGLKCQHADKIALTKLDVLSSLTEIPVITAYERNHKTTTVFDPTENIDSFSPVVTMLPGWKQDISACRKYEDLPENARLYIETLERLLDCDIQFISTGAERNEYMIKGEWL